MSTRLKKVEILATGFYKPSLPLIPVVELRCDRGPQSRNPKATIRGAVPYHRWITMAAEFRGIWRLPES